MNVPTRFNSFCNRVDQLRNPANLAALLHPKAAKPVIEHIDRLDAVLGEFEAAVRSALNPPREGRQLAPQEAVESLAKALTSIARERRTLRVPQDSIYDLVLSEVAEDERPFWKNSRAGYVGGLVEYDQRLRAMLKIAGVFVWRNAVDRDVRLVDSRWCTSPEMIHSHVTDTSMIGRRCRLCTMEESGEVSELQPVDPDQRNGFDVINDVYVLKTGSVNTHELCRPVWEQWVDIANRYAKENQVRG